MALRVLLADESSTIKKVFQLALQDFAVDVRPVNIGVDVVPVAKNFKPDIIFADVLLQKRSGYEVAAEIKQDPALNGVPVVLMWSGFMELDEDKYQASLANAQLEKPFDVAALRKLVTDLVPRTQSQRISQFLSFPEMPEIEEPPAPPEPAPKREDDFTSLSIPKMRNAQTEKFRLNLKPEELEPEHLPVDYEVPEGSGADLLKDMEHESFAVREPHRKASTTTKAAPAPAPAAKPAPKAALPSEPEIDLEPSAPVAPMTEQQLEKIIRAQSKEMIEAVVWKVVPELATQIIERELAKLLREREKHNF